MIALAWGDSKLDELQTGAFYCKADHQRDVNATAEQDTVELKLPPLSHASSAPRISQSEISFIMTTAKRRVFLHSMSMPWLFVILTHGTQ